MRMHGARWMVPLISKDRKTHLNLEQSDHLLMHVLYTWMMLVPVKALR